MPHGQRAACQGAEALGAQQRGFAAAVEELDAALRGETAGREAIHFACHQRQVFAHSLRAVEEFAERAKGHLGPHGPILHFQDALHVAPGRPAAVVAHAIHDQAGFEPGALLQPVEKAAANVRRDAAIVPIGFAIGQHFLAGDALPAV